MCSGISCERSLANDLFDPGLVNRNDGLSLELPDERGQPEAADAEECEERDPGEVEMLAVMRGRDEPIDVDEAHQQDDHGDDTDGLRPVLDRPHQQHEERQEEVEEDQRGGHPAPYTVHPLEV